MINVTKYNLRVTDRILYYKAFQGPPTFCTLVQTVTLQFSFCHVKQENRSRVNWLFRQLDLFETNSFFIPY